MQTDSAMVIRQNKAGLVVRSRQVGGAYIAPKYFQWEALPPGSFPRPSRRPLMTESQRRRTCHRQNHRLTVILWPLLTPYQAVSSRRSSLIVFSSSLFFWPETLKMVYSHGVNSVLLEPGPGWDWGVITGYLGQEGRADSPGKLPR